MRNRLLVAFCLGLALSAQAFAGVYYEAKTKGEGRGAEAQASRVKGWVHGDNARVEFIESGNPMMAAGGYMVTKDGGTTMFFVNPKEKSYSKFDVESMGQMVGGVGKMMNMKFSDVKTDDLGEEMGGVVAGLPTTHYKFRVSYTMAMSFMGMKQSSKVVQEKDVWAAPKLVEAALGVWLRKTPPKMGDEDFDKLVRAQAGKIEGFPLKTIVRQATTDKNGKTETTTTTMEVTRLELDMIPNVSFDVPAGYEEVDMFGAMMGGGKDGEENPLSKMFGGKKK